jgi:hypothetical protein
MAEIVGSGTDRSRVTSVKRDDTGVGRVGA